MKESKQSGLTLTETLAVLSILSIIGLIIWSVFIHGTKYSNQAITKNQMQQEANIIISKLTKIHQISDSYAFTSQDCEILLSYKVEDSPYDEIISSEQLCFFIDNTPEDNTDYKNLKTYTQDNPNTLQNIWIGIEDYKNPAHRVKVEAYLFKLN